MSNDDFKRAMDALDITTVQWELASSPTIIFHTRYLEAMLNDQKERSETVKDSKPTSEEK